MMELFRNELADVTLISVAHRAELQDYHERKLMLHRNASSVEMAPVEEAGRRERFARLLRRSLRPRPSPDPSSPLSR
jgi:vitamin B12/bleomycin/antimicrobial peptide transport system ATP-binding/permease protein